MANKCPSCGASYVYDEEYEGYLDCLVVHSVIKIKGEYADDATDTMPWTDKEIIAWLCPVDGGVVALNLEDHLGVSIYTPNQELL